MENHGIEKTCEYIGVGAQATLLRSILIPKNTIISEGPKRVTYNEKHYELVIGIGKDHTCTLIISASALHAINRLEPGVSIF